eukprot:scaffold77480_cov18-Tisochrysis_lutea.AAC.2
MFMHYTYNELKCCGLHTFVPEQAYITCKCKQLKCGDRHPQGRFQCKKKTQASRFVVAPAKHTPGIPGDKLGAVFPVL